jgi:hypothetical protein
MKTQFLITAAIVALCTTVSAATLTKEDKLTLLEKLKKIREIVESRVDNKLRSALAAYRDAAQNNNDAVELYLKCTEKVNFDHQKKKNSEFREWKRKESAFLEKAGPALRIQLNWLILTLQSSSEKIDQATLISTANDTLTAIYSNPEQYKASRQILDQSVMSSPFATAYNLSSVKIKDNWPHSPAQISQIYEQLILPPLRQTRNIAELRSAWTKRIQMEMVRQEVILTPIKEDEPKKIAIVQHHSSSPEFERYVNEVVPELQWQMEKDLYKHGDEAIAASKMLALIEKHLAHASSARWSNEFKQLLAPASMATSTPQE